MSVATVRGGIPYVLRDTITTGVAPAGGRKVRLPFYINWLKIRVTTNPCKLYFTEADYLADERYVLIPEPTDATPHGEWEGPVETTAGDHSDLWLRGDGGSSAVELVAFQRRG
jgi:hypothetical protein